jgi:hypothetical protein
MISFWFPCITPFDIRLFHLEEAQKLESNYGIENMIVEISNILRDSAKKNVHLKKDKRRN